MMLLPVALGEDHYTLLIVLGTENIQRITQNDPAEIPLHRLPEEWTRRTLFAAHITYANDHDIELVMKKLEEGKVHEAVEFLGRGWRYRPELGDHDDGPQEVMSS